MHSLKFRVKPYPSLVLDLATADMYPLARLGRPPFELEFVRGLELVVVECGGDNLGCVTYRYRESTCYILIGDT